MKKPIITIDGTAASGKSTTARILSQRLKYVYIDSGSMYRACALESFLKKIPISDLDNLFKMIAQIDLKISYSDEGNIIYLSGKNVSQQIREHHISALASEIAVIGFVRKKMTLLQQEMGASGGVIMDGRDIGTVVFPDAKFKFFMKADIETRAKRRIIELKEKNINTDLETLIKEMKWRDMNDTSRKIAPLKKAEDAIEIDTSNLTIEEQVEFLYETITK